MARFLAGFGLASVLWGGVLLAVFQGWIALPHEEPEVVEAPPPEEVEVAEEEPTSSMLSLIHI